MKLTPDKTWIPIGVAIAGIASFVTCAVWISLSMQALEFKQQATNESVQRVEKTLDQLLADGVSTRLLQQWIEILKARNPTLQVPDLPR